MSINLDDFNNWYADNELRWHHCQVSDKDIALSAAEWGNSQNNIERNDSAAGKKGKVSLPSGTQRSATSHNSMLQEREHNTDSQQCLCDLGSSATSNVWLLSINKDCPVHGDKWEG